MSAPLEETLERAQPVVDRILFRRCGGWLRHDEIADIRSSVLLRLMLRLRRAEAPPIADFESFLAVLTGNAVNDYLRRRYPERTRLKNRLRYRLTYSQDFALWTVAGIPICGLREWGTGDTVPSPLDATSGEFPDAAFHEPNGDVALAAVLRTIGRPVTLDDLVSLMENLWQKNRTPPAGVERAVDPAPSAAASLEQRDTLAMLWREIQRLPQRQRAALLLNLRDEDGGNALALLVLAGVAPFDAVASAIGIAPDALASLWSRMPLDDREIAAHLGLSRQQVINLRKAARRRLERFLRRQP